MGYWDRTDEFLRNNHAPTCPRCGEPMFPQDDHGAFTCFCSLGEVIDGPTGLKIFTPKIQQINTSEMTDEEKAQIPPMYRLHDKPTEEEKKFFEDCLKELKES